MRRSHEPSRGQALGKVVELPEWEDSTTDTNGLRE
jgi:hypothetical protein